MVKHGWLAPMATLLLAGCATMAPVAPPAMPNAAARQDLLDYLRAHGTTGFLVVRNGRTLIDVNFPAPSGDAMFPAFVYGTASDGALLEDVASQQKSFVAVLVAIAMDKGLLDPAKSVSAYLGSGWSKAALEQETAIRLVDVLTMTSGLDEGFAYAAPPGMRFFYNTPVYAVTKRMLTTATGRSLEDLTHDWLTRPLGMRDTAWRQRPASLGKVGNATGLVTTPRDMARFGAMVLRGGTAEDGRRIVSRAELQKLFDASPANPGYGRLWWRNGGAFVLGAGGARLESALAPGAPDDLVAALGYLDRRLYVVPSMGLVVVRTGAAANASEFRSAALGQARGAPGSLIDP